jgi:hypothetical protein
MTKKKAVKINIDDLCAIRAVVQDYHKRHGDQMVEYQGPYFESSNAIDPDAETDTFVFVEEALAFLDKQIAGLGGQ